MNKEVVFTVTIGLNGDAVITSCNDSGIEFDLIVGIIDSQKLLDSLRKGKKLGSGIYTVSNDGSWEIVES